MDLKKRRMELGMSLQFVANRVGVSKSTVLRWENGDIENMKRDKVQKLAQVLRISPLEVMGIDKLQEIENQSQIQSQAILDDMLTIAERSEKKQNEAEMLSRVFSYVEKIMSLSEENRNEIKRYIDYVIDKEKNNE